MNGLEVQNLETFVSYPKTPRLFRDIVISEKIDGTNSCVVIGEDGSFRTGSRNRWITPESDNFGFARWCKEHFEELLTLGPGRHFGEFWGQGIQRGYGLTEKRFSLFNVSRWSDDAVEKDTGEPLSPRPACCSIVPVLYQGPFLTSAIQHCLETLAVEGSVASPRFARAEGIVIFHTAAQRPFKVLLENDDSPKSES